MADPNALTQAVAAWEAYERLGSPEGDLALVQLVIYLAPHPSRTPPTRRRAPPPAPPAKPVRDAAHAHPQRTDPHDEGLGYSEGYVYDHDTEEGFSGQNYFPDGMARRRFYKPLERGFEREVAKRLEYWDKLRRERKPEGE